MSTTTDQDKNDLNKNTTSADMVKKEDYDRVISDFQKTKDTLSTLEKERTDLAARLQALETKKKEETGDFKSLADQYKGAADDWKNKYEGLKTSMLITEKHKQASQALLKSGMSPDALKILDKETFDELQAEVTSQGRILVHGVDLYVDKFKKEYGFAFQSGTAPKVNTGGGSDGGGANTTALDASGLFKLEQECKKKGDMGPYHKAYKEYLENRKTK